MSELNNQAGLAFDFLRIHRAITRGLKVTLEKGSEFIKNGFPTPELKKGYLMYVQALTIILEAHHLSEDEVAFPAFKEKLPSVPYANLAADHVEVEAFLKQVRAHIPAASGQDGKDSLAAIVEGVDEIYGIWGPHIRIEEWNFTKAALDAVMNEAEQMQLSKLMGKHNQEHAVPPFLALPFVLFNLEADDRAAMAANFPPMIINELIPVAWKDQWAPMKPFFLE